jgi:hypothetical protein
MSLCGAKCLATAAGTETLGWLASAAAKYVATPIIFRSHTATQLPTALVHVQAVVLHPSTPGCHVRLMHTLSARCPCIGVISHVEPYCTSSRVHESHKVGTIHANTSDAAPCSPQCMHGRAYPHCMQGQGLHGVTPVIVRTQSSVRSKQHNKYCTWCCCQCCHQQLRKCCSC